MSPRTPSADIPDAPAQAATDTTPPAAADTSPFDLLRVHDTHPGVDADRTVPRLLADSDPGRYRIQPHKPAVDHEGRPLPLKPHTTN